jgi:hypothetical protein
VGTIFIIITSISMIIGIFLGSYVAGGIASDKAHLFVNGIDKIDADFSGKVSF